MIIPESFTTIKGFELYKVKLSSWTQIGGNAIYLINCK